MMTDPIADMLTRIRNANDIERPFVEMPATKLKVALAKVLLEEGFILGYRTGKYAETRPRTARTRISSEVDEPRRAARDPAGLPEVRPGRRAGDPPHRAVLASPAAACTRATRTSSACSTASASPSCQHEQGRDVRPRGQEGQGRRRGSLHGVVECECRAPISKDDADHSAWIRTTVRNPERRKRCLVSASSRSPSPRG